jgi:hypothetical protein
VVINFVAIASYLISNLPLVIIARCAARNMDRVLQDGFLPKRQKIPPEEVVEDLEEEFGIRGMKMRCLI